MAVPADYIWFLPLADDAIDNAGNIVTTSNGSINYTGEYCEIDGSAEDQYISLDNGSTDRTTWTFSGWVYVPSGQNYGEILYDESDGSIDCYHSVGDENSFTFNSDVNMDAAANDDEWYNFTITSDGTKSELYINASLKTTGSGVSTFYGTVYHIGKYKTTYTTIKASKFRFYDRVLTSSEIQDIYDEGYATENIHFLDKRMIEALHIQSFLDKRITQDDLHIHSFLDKRGIEQLHISSFLDKRGIEQLHISSFLDKRDIYTGMATIFSDTRIVSRDLKYSRFFDIREIESDPSYIFVKRVN